jgi:hypothetical protein
MASDDEPDRTDAVAWIDWFCKQNALGISINAQNDLRRWAAELAAWHEAEVDSSCYSGVYMGGGS